MSLFGGLFKRKPQVVPNGDTHTVREDAERSPYGRGRPFRFEPLTGSGPIPPSEPGMYYVRNSENEIQYIGETNDLRRRLGEHQRAGRILPGDTLDYKLARQDSCSKTRRVVETVKIQQHRPPRNRRAGGGGRPASH